MDTHSMLHDSGNWGATCTHSGRLSSESTTCLASSCKTVSLRHHKAFNSESHITFGPSNGAAFQEKPVW